MKALLVIVSILVLILSGCAHPINISANPENIVLEPGSPQKIAARVGYYIADEAMKIEAVTPGGGGDSVRYFPYRDLEAGYSKMLKNVFQSVTKVSAETSAGLLEADNIKYVITPKVLTNSSSVGIMTWPPTQFSVDLTSSIRDAAGKPIASLRVVGNGQYRTVLSMTADHGTAGKRAMEDALLQMQRALIETKYSPVPASVAKTNTEERETLKASGSGALVSSDGYILTAAHVVIKAKKVVVVTSLGQRNAKILRIDEANDIAVLKLEDGVYPALPVAPSRQVRLGQSVATIGFPNTELQGFSPKLTKGEISSLNGFVDDPRAWQISVPLQPGNSGGPLLDKDGNLIGVVVSGLSWKVMSLTDAIPQNVNYAVKSVYALALLEPYLNADDPKPTDAQLNLSFEDMVARAQQSAVLILVY